MLCPKCGNQINGVICDSCALNLHKNRILSCGNEAETSIRILSKTLSHLNSSGEHNRPQVITEEPDDGVNRQNGSDKPNHNNKGLLIGFSVFIILAISSFAIIFISNPNLFIGDTSSSEAVSTFEESDIAEAENAAQESIHYYHLDLPKNSSYPENTYFGPDCYSEVSENSKDDELVSGLLTEFYKRLDKDPVLAAACLANLDKTIGTSYSAHVTKDYDEWFQKINQTSKAFISDQEQWKGNVYSFEQWLNNNEVTVVDNTGTINRMGMDSSIGDWPYITLEDDEVNDGHLLHIEINIKGSINKLDYYIEGGFIPVNIEYDYSKFTLDY